MEERRILIADTAIAVVADVGVRGLTHRAVDASANLATGSTSYYARSKAQLLDLTVERLVSLLRGYTEHTALAAATPADGDELTATLTEWLSGLYSDYQGELRARNSLVLELENREGGSDSTLLREALVAADDLSGPLASAGVDPAAAEALLAALEGLLWEHSAGRHVGDVDTTVDARLLGALCSSHHHASGDRRGIFGLRR